MFIGKKRIITIIGFNKNVPEFIRIDNQPVESTL